MTTTLLNIISKANFVTQLIGKLKIFTCLRYLTSRVKEAADYFITTVHDSCWEILGHGGGRDFIAAFVQSDDILPANVALFKAWVIGVRALNMMIWQETFSEMTLSFDTTASYWASFWPPAVIDVTLYKKDMWQKKKKQHASK